MPDVLVGRPPTYRRTQLDVYRQLVDVAYGVVQRCPHLSVLATSLVNPRHPLSPQDLELMRWLETREGAPVPTSGWRHFRRFARRWAGGVLWAARETCRLVRLRRGLRPAVAAATREPADVVMKTWVFGRESLTRDADFYYGTLPHDLQRHGVRYVVLCGDAREPETDGRFARGALGRTAIRYFPERALIPLWAPAVSCWRQLRAGLALWRIARSSDDPLVAVVAAHLSVEVVRAYVTAATLYYFIARAAVKTWGARAFVTLYEGQTWEKPSWIGAREADERCVVVGYQHTVLMPHSLSVLSPPDGGWARCAPDCVLCLGPIPGSMLEPGHQRLATTIVPFGSFRRANAFEPPRLPDPARRTILVMPEGLPPEAKALFDFALSAAPRLASYHFILRCHPVLPFEQVRAHLRGDVADHANVEVSTRPIDEDYARSSVVLYRGTSAVLYAILHGLKPVYLHDDRYPDVDPLFALHGWRAHVASAAELSRVLRDYDDQSLEEAAAAWRVAAEYVDGYTISVSASAVDRFLAAAGLAREGSVR